ncbi:hypothetical protein UPYG_G00295330 [Umbra pygmaea]|uniref:Zona pellucida sperm-binding protein 4 n=1 Tax=Umbra pygmaea TaxID=75934 RepID=A0ABD0W5I4_UMBPY
MAVRCFSFRFVLLVFACSSYAQPNWTFLQYHNRQPQDTSYNPRQPQWPEPKWPQQNINQRAAPLGPQQQIPKTPDRLEQHLVNHLLLKPENSQQETPPKPEIKDLQQQTPHRPEPKRPHQQTPKEPQPQEPQQKSPEMSELQDPHQQNPEMLDIQEPQQQTPEMSHPQKPQQQQTSDISELQEPQQQNPEMSDIQEPQQQTPEMSHPQKPQQQQTSDISELQKPQQQNPEMSDIQEPQQQTPEMLDPQKPQPPQTSDISELQEPQQQNPEMSDIQEPQQQTPEISHPQKPQQPQTPDISELQEPQQQNPEMSDIKEPQQQTPEMLDPQKPQPPQTSDISELQEPQQQNPEMSDIQEPQQQTPEMLDRQKPQQPQTPDISDIQEPQQQTPEMLDPQNPKQPQTSDISHIQEPQQQTLEMSEPQTPEQQQTSDISELQEAQQQTFQTSEPKMAQQQTPKKPETQGPQLLDPQRPETPWPLQQTPQNSEAKGEQQQTPKKPAPQWSLPKHLQRPVPQWSLQYHHTQRPVPQWSLQHHLQRPLPQWSLQKPLQRPAIIKHPDQRCQVQTRNIVQCGKSKITRAQCKAINCCHNGQQCYYGKTVTVQCTKDGQFVVVVARDTTWPRIDTDSIRLLGGNDSPCSPVGITSGFAIYQFPVTACGTILKEGNGYVTYENRIVSSYEVLIAHQGSITRDSHFELLFQCKFSAVAVEALVMEMNTVPIPTSIAALGPLRVELRLAKGACNNKGCTNESRAFTSYYSQEDYPVTKVLRQPVYVEVRLLQRKDPTLVLMLDHCWATSAPSAVSMPQWELVVKECSYPNDKYLTTMVPVEHSSGLLYPTHYKRFVLLMFTFVDHTLDPKKDSIFIHCSTSLCHPTRGYSCQSTCNRPRRDVVAQRKTKQTAVVSSGEVVLVDTMPATAYLLEQ